MIQEIVGDLLRDGKGMICHQVNYQGVMGGGIAYSIAEKLLSQKQYREYQHLCAEKGKKLLGTNWYAKCGDVIVANMFCQNAEPRNGQDLTNYVAMELCFCALRKSAENLKVPIFIPAFIGCGIAGGDWNRVKSIIKRTLEAAAVPVTIVYWEADRRTPYVKDGAALIMPSDTVLHKPTGETWVVCGVDHQRGELIPCGYPFPTLAKVADCELIEEHYSQEGQQESWVRALREHGYDRFIIKSEAVSEDAVEPDNNEQPAFTPGMEVWIIERDERGEPFQVAGAMFLADVCGYIITSAYINDIDNIGDTLEYLANETRENYGADLLVYPKSDCFFTQDAAHDALNSYTAE